MTKLKKLNLVLGQEQSVSADALQILALITDSVEEGSDIDAAVYSEVGYAEAIEKLQAAFPSLRIRAVKTAIWFADPEVRRILVSNASINKDGDDYILVSEAEAVTALPNMRGNTVIKSFDELEKFTGIKTTSALGSSQGQFQNCTNLESVRFPDSITTNNATYVFNGCTKLSRVKLPSTLKTIGSYFFSECSALDMDCEELIPQTVETLGDRAFQNSAVRGRLNLPNLKTIPYLAFSNSKIEEIVDLGSITSTPTTASTGVFQGCVNLRSVVLPSTLTTLGYRTFYGCTSLERVSGWENLISIGESSFDTIPVGGELDFPNLTSIGNNAFRRTAITKIISLGGITSLVSAANGSGTFYGCNQLVSARLPSSLKTIGNYTFGTCSALETVDLNGASCSIGDNVFTGCASLASVSGGVNVSSIGAYAFRNCSSLVSEVNFPRLTTLGLGAFRDSGITKIVDLGSITTVAGNTSGEGAFRGCKSLEEVAIPSTVTTIAGYAFNGCSALSKLSGGENVREIQAWAFQSTGEIEDINFPNLESLSAGVFATSKIKRVSNLGKITILSNANNGQGVFQGCTQLQSVFLPSTLTQIGNYHFSGCSALETLEFTSDACMVGGSTFSGNSSLKVVRGSECITSIGGNGFYGCGKLNLLVLGDGLESVGQAAFAACTKLNIVIKRAVPPTCGANVLTNSTSASIYVPTASVDTYKAASGWSSWASRIKGFEEVETLPESGVEGMYYLKGENLYRFTSGERQVLDIESGEWRLDL